MSKVATLNQVSFDIKPSGKLLIPNDALNDLLRFRQNSIRKNEGGGILLGRRFENTNNVIIDEITTPIRGDKRSRTSFYRSIGHHKIAQKKWTESNGTCLYLGLWHTHPETTPNPSSVDYKDWIKALKQGQYEDDHLFFIIVGTKNINCWQGRNKNKIFRSIKTTNNFKLLRRSYE